MYLTTINYDLTNINPLTMKYKQKTLNYNLFKSVIRFECKTKLR